MNDKINDMITKYGDEVFKWLQDSGQFVKEQAPLVCQEAIHWGQVESIFFSLIGIAVLALAFFLYKKGRYYLKLKPYPSEDGYMFCFMGSGFTAIIGIMIFSINLHHFLFITFAPRLYLLEQIKEILK